MMNLILTILMILMISTILILCTWVFLDRVALGFAFGFTLLPPGMNIYQFNIMMMTMMTIMIMTRTIGVLRGS